MLIHKKCPETHCTCIFYLQEIVVEPPNSAIKVDFRPIQLKPDILQPTTVASISYTGN